MTANKLVRPRLSIEDANTGRCVTTRNLQSHSYLFTQKLEKNKSGKVVLIWPTNYQLVPSYYQK